MTRMKSSMMYRMCFVLLLALTISMFLLPETRVSAAEQKPVEFVSREILRLIS